MQRNLRLIDPLGQHRATLPVPASPETLLRTAMALTDTMQFVVCIVGANEWSLAILTDSQKLVPFGPSVPEIPRTQYRATRSAIIETAWLDFIDNGWSVIVEGSPATTWSV